MPSQNILLGSGVIPEPVLEKNIPVINLRAPAWRFHKDYPDRLCKTDEELDKLDAEGWIDKPGKARRLPGHEKVYDAYHSIREDKPSIETSLIKEKAEDEIRADILKAESDKVEVRRIEAEKAEEAQKVIAQELEEEKKRNKDYEESKNPPGPRLCTLCGLTFPTLLGLNRHLERVHRGRKGKVL